jgi:hypothetical protein
MWPSTIKTRASKKKRTQLHHQHLTPPLTNQRTDLKKAKRRQHQHHHPQTKPTPSTENRTRKTDEVDHENSGEPPHQSSKTEELRWTTFLKQSNIAVSGKEKNAGKTSDGARNLHVRSHHHKRWLHLVVRVLDFRVDGGGGFREKAEINLKFTF